MRISGIRLRKLRLPLREPFEASYGVENDKVAVIVTVTADTGAVGYAECVAMSAPLYTEETVETAWYVLRTFLAPRLMGVEVSSREDLHAIGKRFSFVRGHQMAKAALEMAVWDLYAHVAGVPLHRLLGGTRSEIPVGISVGIQPDTRQLLRKVEGYLAQGFQRVKIKIKPGFDMAPVQAVRAVFPDVPLMVDANSAYTLADAEHLRRLDAFGLLMIEQPLAWDDMVDHAALQQQLETPICLDESIRSAADARKAIELGACKVVNLKLGRVGGFAEALRIHDLCQDGGLDLWCGGMLETGIGRLHNIAVTSLAGFTLPGDTAPSDRYFAEDIISPPVEFSRPGMLAVEEIPGVASRVNEAALEKWVVEETRL
ncbi:o-succinylbenzoate synthase [Alicyclobacillus cycloheptanicus]|uniref:o-succinylbenzoate synthase n=1 Tax=Alicyclobacillus cycloheptanicus TaxID=1457 RepID=A0ABT9XM14_9BACL|nr:o-succinylbenzoate synthase [Alicyclobacillus cycloheptanicus]MDQ0191347.1 O-succinylbenzoate synthase [Alicyclobacillus cycloheptanicus]WDL99830.1 o-succinylbenzoate synthase [Alicyclobacillus cycloheptanicus]